MKSPRQTFPIVSRPGSDLSSGEKRKLCLLCALGLMVAIATGARAANSSAPPSNQQYVKSVFGATAKDPFFPRSTRFTGTVPVTTTPDLIPAPMTALKLGGISGPKNRRLAIINNKTFETGEEGDIKVMGQTFKVKCVEIRDDGATVSVNGQVQKLLLKP
jgi:hypothetical protein